MLNQQCLQEHSSMFSSQTSACKQALNPSSRRIYHNQQVDNPVLQCLQIKQLQSKNSTDVERYRCVFSDIDNFIQSMLGTCTWRLLQEAVDRDANLASLELACARGKAQERLFREDQPIPSARCQG